MTIPISVRFSLAQTLAPKHYREFNTNLSKRLSTHQQSHRKFETQDRAKLMLRQVHAGVRFTPRYTPTDTQGSRGFSLSESWGRNHGRRGTGGEAEPRNLWEQMSLISLPCSDDWQLALRFSALNKFAGLHKFRGAVPNRSFVFFVHPPLRPRVYQAWNSKRMSSWSAYSDLAAHLFSSCPFGFFFRVRETSGTQGNRPTEWSQNGSVIVTLWLNRSSATRSGKHER